MAAPSELRRSAALCLAAVTATWSLALPPAAADPGQGKGQAQGSGAGPASGQGPGKHQGKQDGKQDGRRGGGHGKSDAPGKGAGKPDNPGTSKPGTGKAGSGKAGSGKPGSGKPGSGKPGNPGGPGRPQPPKPEPDPQSGPARPIDGERARVSNQRGDLPVARSTARRTARPTAESAHVSPRNAADPGQQAGEAMPRRGEPDPIASAGSPYEAEPDVARVVDVADTAATGRDWFRTVVPLGAMGVLAVAAAVALALRRRAAAAAAPVEPGTLSIFRT